MMLKAQTAHIQNKFREAGNYYKKAVELDSLNYENMGLYANFRYITNKHNEALTYLLKMKAYYVKAAESDSFHDLESLHSLLTTMGSCYDKLMDSESLHQNYLNIINILKKLATCKPGIYLHQLASLYTVYGLKYDNQEYLKK